ncbi:MAG: DUF3179 domain-containing protein [Gemmatimonadetes bacterium]|nr:DUF3179 domain-containing protein [Gemmatimonadota bacterium]
MARTPRIMTRWANTGPVPTLLAVVALAGCGAGPAESPDDPSSGNPFTPQMLPRCHVTSDMLFSGGAGRGGIPALVNPTLVPRGHPDAQYLDDYVRLAEGRDDLPDARVVGMVVDGTPVAIPYNILWWHEIVNVELGGRVLAVTYCPLTGSAIVFDATAAGAGQFGVSGLIFRNNLVMFDVETESLWPQMCEVAAIGSKQGTQLVRVRGFEMLWEAWKDRYPETLVVGSETGFDFNYLLYPYGFYEVDDFLLFGTQGPVDPRLPLKERVLGIPGEDGGMALPFSTLESSGTTTILQLGIDRGTALVLWDATAGTAAAYLPQTVAGELVTIRTSGNGFMDTETGSLWNVEGVAVEGPMTGARLAIYDGAFVAFWFAWSQFHPDTRVWTVE